jgi:two-component system LytT family response regulator
MESIMRAAILDDEPLARERLRDFLKDETDVELVGEYRNGMSFLRELPTSRPDLVFIDVEMPALSGFDVLEQMRSTSAIRPYVVFVTAFESYAVRAFDAEATDYLLKPFDAQRFTRMLNRVRKQIAKSAVPEERNPPASDSTMTRVAIKNAGRIQFVRLDQVDWIEAAANYVRLHIGQGSHLFRGSMVTLEQRLDPARFVRIHRSTIVNVDRIAEMHPSFAREHIVVLQDGTRLRLSPTYRERLEALVEGL